MLAPVPPEGGHIPDVAGKSRESVLGEEDLKRPIAPSTHSCRSATASISLMKPQAVVDDTAPLTCEPGRGHGGPDAVRPSLAPPVDASRDHPGTQHEPHAIAQPQEAATRPITPCPPSPRMSSIDPTLAEARSTSAPTATSPDPNNARPASAPHAGNGTPSLSPPLVDLEESDSDFDTDRDLPGSLTQMVAGLNRPRVPLVAPLVPCVSVSLFVRSLVNDYVLQRPRPARRYRREGPQSQSTAEPSQGRCCYHRSRYARRRCQRAANQVSAVLEVYICA